MANSEQFQFEELDELTREYLRHVRDQSGHGMPGVFIPRKSPTPIHGFFTGVAVLMIAAAIAWNEMGKEPLAVAMLQTAGLLLGGWLVANALRDRIAARGQNSSGHFVYADAKTLWECAGPSVTATPVSSIVELDGIQNYDNRGRHTHIAVSMRTAKGLKTFIVRDAARAREFVAFLNSIVSSRFAPSPAGGFGANEGSSPTSYHSASRSSVAKYLAEKAQSEGEESFGATGAEVPTPKRERRSSSGILNYLLIVGVGVGGVFAFNELNLELRDDIVWLRINQIDPQEQRAPWLRGYLVDARNTKHRDEAHEMLRGIYGDAANKIREGTYLKTEYAGGLKVTSIKGPVTEKVDKELSEAFAEVVCDLAEQPSPLVSVTVKELGEDRDGRSEREKEMMKQYTLTLLEGIGPELIAFVESPPETKGMIDITYEFDRAGPAKDAPRRCTLNFTFRKSTDSVPLRSVRKYHNATSALSVAAAGEIAEQFGLKTAGSKKDDLQATGR